MTHRPLHKIAAEIDADWPLDSKSPVSRHWAEPYLNAMRSLNSIEDSYGADDARSVVLYFLSNATQWRGPTAKRIKAEVKEILK